jgi:hypothetical protein
LDSIEEFNEYKEKEGIMKKLQGIIDLFMGKYTFLGILLLASIPNPLFDLAGIFFYKK